MLLRGPREAGAVAARVAERVGREGAALVIDRSVYASLRSRQCAQHQISISDFRFQIPTPGAGRQWADIFVSGDFRFRFEIAAGHKSADVSYTPVGFSA